MEGKSIEEFEVSEELKEKLGKAESLDEVVKILAEEGLEVTKEELEAALAQGENGELSEETLSAVSGGRINWWRFIGPLLPLPIWPRIPRLQSVKVGL